MIYCVEDEAHIRELIVYALKNSDYEVEGFESGEELFEAMRREMPQLILLDIMLPGQDGLEILDCIRSNDATRDVPVIMLTAKSSELDKIVGLDKGADDYVVKPFSVLELIARVKAVLRRAEPRNDPYTIEIDGVEINDRERTVRVDGEEVNLTYKEFELLLYLFKNKNIVLHREKIMAQVWGYDFEGESRTVDVHIASLRHKLKDKAYLIETVRNIGYKVGYP
ncbi:MAG: response regulator transcription factor [Peptoniphilus sp.]|nr:response regulator transcription factor [Peptoniphilus sp.]MDD7363706.1 response regulator transcription factor [Bacillota bacterium]MDY6044091.1 response regulator transcription factor [Peptoniphilus sp.]